MSNVYKNTNIENYIIVKKSEPAGSNDHRKLLMFPTSMITGFEPLIDSDTGNVVLKFARATAQANHDRIDIALTGNPLTVHAIFALVNEIVGVLQRSSHTTKGSVIVLSDEVAGTVATESIDQTVGMTITATAL